MENQREFDVILWGASGFTGRLVAEYFLSRYPDNLKWAMAGRNQQKLEEVRSAIGGDHIPLVIADSMDRASLDQMTIRTKVICTTVGPYAKYGSELVASCIENQADYCDLTGEVQWMRKMIDEHHAQAEAKGVRIVHTCGFDSIPSDMGVYFLQREIKKDKGVYAAHIKLRVKAMKGKMSGGTYASLSYVMEEAAGDKSIYKTLLDPYGLNPKDSQRGNDQPDLNKVIYDEDARSWLAPFIMAVINTKVVRRSHALSGYPYGPSFRYDEAMMTGDGIGGRAKGLVTAGVMGIMMAGKPGSILKKVTDKVLPDPGEGPNKQERENGFFNIQLIAKMPDGTILRGKVTGDKDPGYGSTSKMLGEAAVCLAKDRDKCPEVAGMLTPATALGDIFLERLTSKAGLTFDYYN